MRSVSEDERKAPTENEEAPREVARVANAGMPALKHGEQRSEQTAFISLLLLCNPDKV